MHDYLPRSNLVKNLRSQEVLLSATPVEQVTIPKPFRDKLQIFKNVEGVSLEFYNILFYN
jgi:hypothetical protein